MFHGEQLWLHERLFGQIVIDLPQVTSYDYDALNERGNQDKYYKSEDAEEALSRVSTDGAAGERVF